MRERSRNDVTYLKYNRRNIPEDITKGIFTLNRVSFFYWGFVVDVTCGLWLTGRSNFNQHLACLLNQGTSFGRNIGFWLRNPTAWTGSRNVSRRGQPMGWHWLIAMTVAVDGWFYGPRSIPCTIWLYSLILIPQCKFPVDHFPIKSSLILNSCCFILLNSFIMALTVSSVFTHCLHLLYCSVMLALIWLVFIVSLSWPCPCLFEDNFGSLSPEIPIQLFLFTFLFSSFFVYLSIILLLLLLLFHVHFFFCFLLF